MSVYLSKNFTIDQLIFSETAQRLNIPNYPNQQQIDNLKALCVNLLEPFYAIDKFRISSGYRCPDLNKAIGSSITSHHTKGMAADCVPVKYSTRDFLGIIKNKKLQFTQCILEFGWVHLSYDPKDLRNQFLIANKTKKGIVYLPYKF
jgi:hypothetical protein